MTRKDKITSDARKALRRRAIDWLRRLPNDHEVFDTLNALMPPPPPEPPRLLPKIDGPDPVIVQALMHVAKDSITMRLGDFTRRLEATAVDVETAAAVASCTPDVIIDE
jgi:hypothetical protein